MAVNRKVIDLSHWDTVTSWSDIKAAGIVGVIHKATESTTYVDPNYISRKQAALNAGLLWGAYHFAHSGNVAAQVNAFIGVTGIDKTMLYALDWEDTAAGTMTAAEAQQFISYVEAVTGVNTMVIYSGNTAKERLGSAANGFFGRRRLWLAEYGSTPVTQASWPMPWLWQYSDGVSGPDARNCPGVSGECDTSSWTDTDSALIAQWAGIPVAPPVITPPPITPTVTITTTGAVQLSVNGVVVPMPKEVLTMGLKPSTPVATLAMYTVVANALVPAIQAVIAANVPSAFLGLIPAGIVSSSAGAFAKAAVDALVAYQAAHPGEQ